MFSLSGGLYCNLSLGLLIPSSIILGLMVIYSLFASLLGYKSCHKNYVKQPSEYIDWMYKQLLERPKISLGTDFLNLENNLETKLPGLNKSQANQKNN